MQQIPNLLDSTEPQNFGVPHKNEVTRKTVVAVIYDPESQTYLYQFWPDYHQLTCLLSGGVEAAEHLTDATHREIREETGYTDYAILGRLGGVIYSHYLKASTNQYFVKEIIPYLVILGSHAHQELQKEDDEAFENHFASSAEIIRMMGVYEDATGETLADHKEILRRGVEHITQTKL